MGEDNKHLDWIPSNPVIKGNTIPIVLLFRMQEFDLDVSAFTGNVKFREVVLDPMILAELIDKYSTTVQEEDLW